MKGAVTQMDKKTRIKKADYRNPNRKVHKECIQSKSTMNDIISDRKETAKMVKDANQMKMKYEKEAQTEDKQEARVIKKIYCKAGKMHKMTTDNLKKDHSTCRQERSCGDVHSDCIAHYGCKMLFLE